MLEMTVTIDGRYTGYGAMVICQPAASCMLNCGQSGCFKLNYVSLSGAVCDITPAGCGKGGVVNYGDGKVLNGKHQYRRRTVLLLRVMRFGNRNNRIL